MRAAIINEHGIVQNTIEVEQLSDYSNAVDCPDWVSIGMDIKTPKPITIVSAAQNKIDAIRRLSETDWVNQPDVYNIENVPHLLNRQEFLTYRGLLRTIAVNPIEGDIIWPSKPKEIWSS